ncbi:MAG: DUF4112 domain-containing protein [Pseudomonadota bacterium]
MHVAALTRSVKKRRETCNPLLGDVFDVAFKANSKNIRIIMTHAERQIDADSADGDHERIA